jgi:hypothetical protein
VALRFRYGLDRLNFQIGDKFRIRAVPETGGWLRYPRLFF